ncbi:MAG TPA: type VI secretion system contractile sheath small subunit [Acidobacteriota bacterium]|nr:type VI secretion system contractile sheath small subunit [Acidobacteriota bacterium]
MPKESSVAPRERINIVYKPATGGAQEEIELPFKQLVMADFTLRQDDRPLEDRAPINVDKDNFNEVMRKQNLTLNFTVPNRLSDQEGDELPVNLRVETLKDLEPESVAGQVPELKKLTELRDALTALKGPLGNVPGFRKKLQELLQDDTARERLMKELGMGPEKKE